MFKRSAWFFLLAASMIAASQNGLESDVFKTAGGVLRITFIGHASLLFQFRPAPQAGELNIYVDPDGRRADFAAMPKADLILVSHQHGDHFDPRAIEALRQAGTEIIVTPSCLPLPAAARIMKNGDRSRFHEVAIEAVPAYNVVHKRPDGTPYHPRGEGNGYVLSFPGLRVYVAGDTENIPEMAEIKNIDIAFLPMNLPYTMTPEMTAQAARTVKPRVLYPYHFSDTDPQRLVALLKDEADMDVRVRKLN
jgi:L-ascorbate metabolism protein UlaG (beta-lactamase superfamily)